MTCNASGGTGSYTYTWSISGVGWSIVSGQGTDNVQIQVQNGFNAEYSCTVTCTVNDGSNSVAPSGGWTMVYGVPN